MNLKIEMPDFKLEMQNSDARRVEIVLQMISAALTGAAISLKPDNNEQIPAEIMEKVEAARPVNSKRNHIKTVNGMRTYPSGHTQYQCSYDCTCGKKGVRYIDKGTETITCHGHDCDYEMWVVGATDLKSLDGVPLPDMQDNYYLAR